MNVSSYIPRALIGHVRAEANPEQLFRNLQNSLDTFKAQHNGRLDNIEAVINSGLGAGTFLLPGNGSGQSWGEQLAASDALKSFVNAAGKGRIQIELSPHAAITSIGTSAGPLIQPERADAVFMARRRLTVRGLLGVGTTGSNMVEYPRQNVRDNQAATVAEGALKPESNYGFALAQAKVATIAHWVAVSRQAMDDAGQIKTIIDGELRYGLALKEETQLLLGDGVGTNLLGLIPQATAYDATGQAAGSSKFDVLLRAIAQAEGADLPATGIVLNSVDWMRLQGLKDTQGRYIGSGPMGSPMPSAWGLDCVPSNSMLPGKFLVGNFANAATIYDRMTPIVLVSSEDRDNLIRNMLTVLCEERLALAVRQPAALIYGDYSAAAG